MTRQRILLIDDHDPIRFGLRCLLEAEGYEVQEADDGLEAVRVARDWRPHVAVVDIDLPLLDGYGVARQLREFLGDDIRLIALTGREERERALASGFDDYLHKPAAPERVQRLLQEEVSR